MRKEGRGKRQREGNEMEERGTGEGKEEGSGRGMRRERSRRWKITDEERMEEEGRVEGEKDRYNDGKEGMPRIGKRRERL